MYFKRITNILHYVPGIILGSMFIWQCWETMQKYFEYRTSVQVIAMICSMIYYDMSLVNDKVYSKVPTQTS